MKIRKIGHCCLVVEVDGKKIMTDPGAWTTGQTLETGIDLVLITHEHADHLHVESLKEVLQNNPGCKVVTNSSVAVLLSQNGIASEILEEGELIFEGVNLFAKTCQHAEIYKTINPVQNTGYMIADKFFYPGDAFLEIEKDVEILAVPVAAPWCKISEVLEYILKVNPKKVIPVHDGFVDLQKAGVFHNLPKKICEENDVDFIPLMEKETYDTEK